MSKSPLGLLLIVLLVVSFVLISTTPFSMEQASTNASNLSPITISADKYLITVYNSTLKLIPETNNNVYWITSDNLLAYFALQNYNLDVSNSIKNTIMAYASTYGLPKDSNGLPIDYKHEAIIGDILTQPFGGANTYYLYNGTSYNLQAEIDNGTNISNWQQYADLCAYQGLSYVNQGDLTGAVSCYKNMMALWDGKGFADAPYQNDTPHLYQTYKLALALTLQVDANITATYANQVMYNTILLMQDSNSGGVYTSYNSNIQAVGSTNTETTALVAIANPTNTTPTPTPTAEFPSLSVVILFIALSLSITVVVITARKRKIGKSKRWQNLNCLT